MFLKSKNREFCIDHHISCLLVSMAGVTSLSIDMKEQKMTVIGDVDPVEVVSKIRKRWHAKIVSVGPKDEPKKEEPKKEEAKKDDGKKADDKKDDGKKKEEQIAELVKAYKAYNPYMTTHYRVMSVEENPNACVIF